LKNNLEAIVLGGGGHARVLLDTVLKAKYRSIGIIDRAIPPGKKILDVEVIGTESLLSKGLNDSSDLFIGIGFHPKNNERQSAFSRLKKMGLNVCGVLSPQSYISKESKLGEGVHVLTNSIIHSGVIIGANSIINTKSSVDHDSIIGKNCHLAPGAIICGNCSIGEGVYIGAGAVVINNITIGSNCLIAAGATVFKDLPDNTIYYGNN